VLVKNQRQTQPIGHLEAILSNPDRPYGLRTETNLGVMNIAMRSTFVETQAVRTRMGRLALVTVVALAVACVPTATPTPAPSTLTPATTAPAPTATLARPSPSPTPAPTPSPSPSPTASQSPGSTPVACPEQKGGNGANQAQITAIRAAHNPGFDRVVFEFGPSSVGPYGMPPWSVAVANGFVGTSGRQVPVDGNAFLGVRFSNASTVDPTTGAQTFTQTDLHPGLPLVRNVKLVEDFERVMIWGIGLERLVCPKVSELAGPVRLVLDLPTPP
jgi:hypothetical protein